MRLWQHKPAVSALVAVHIGVRPEYVEMSHPSAWKRGGFNLVVPMLIKGDTVGLDKVMLCIPIPSKVGEEKHPGSVADKIRCETASYVWMQQHCPEVRIPYLYGFSIPGAIGGQVCIF